MTWNDDLWPLVIQLYQKKPTGIKPIYCRDSVKLALELHIPPQTIYRKMSELRTQPSPSLQRFMKTVGRHPDKLDALCTQLRSLNGMGNASEFYDDVKVNETFELDFRPVNARTAQMMGRPLFTPVMLIMILDLYFRLIPSTMIPETPDVQDLAKLLDITPQDIAEILGIYQYCDPCIHHDDSLMDPMLPPCTAIWRRFANDDLTPLSNLAQQLTIYWK